MFGFFKDIFKTREGEKVIYRKDTPYNRILVLDDGQKLKLILDPSYNLHSVLFKNKVITGSYWDMCAILSLFFSFEGGTVLILGFGGGSVSRIIKSLAPWIKVLGVDIDKEVLHVARKFFDAKADYLLVDKFDSFIEYVRMKFKVVFVDVFQNAMIPFSIFEQDFWSNISGKSEYGVIVNTVSVIQAEGIREVSRKFFPVSKIVKNPESENYVVVNLREFDKDFFKSRAQNIKELLQIKSEKSKNLAHDIRDILLTIDYILDAILR